MLAVTVAAAPLYVERWHVGPLPTTLLENLIGLTVLLYVISWILSHGPLPGRTPYDIAIALLLISGLIGSFVASDHRSAIGIYRAYLIEPIAVFYLAIAVTASEADIVRLLGVWCVGTSLFAIDEIVVVLRAFIAHTLVAGHAAAAFDINPNAVALYLEPLIGVAAGFALFGRGRIRLIAVASAVLFLLAELATLSRGGLLALGVLAVIAVLTVSNVPLRIALAGASVLAALLLRFVPVIGPRLSHALDPGTGTAFVRVDIWIVTLRMLRDRPLFGAGISGYQTTVAPYRAADPNLSPEPYPHNILLTTWTELGLLGLLSFLYIVVNLMVRPWRALSRATGLYRPLLWGLGAAFAMFAVHGLVDSPYWKNDLSLEFWVLAALEVVAIRTVTAKART